MTTPNKKENDMTDRVFFPAPPPAARGGRPDSVFTDEVREDLRSNPGEWTKIHTAKSSAMGSIWKKRYGAEGYDFVTRKVEGETAYDIWATYNGDAEEGE